MDYEGISHVPSSVGDFRDGHTFGYNVNSSLDLPYFQPVINSK